MINMYMNSFHMLDKRADGLNRIYVDEWPHDSFCGQVSELSATHRQSFYNKLEDGKLGYFVSVPAWRSKKIEMEQNVP